MNSYLKIPALMVAVLITLTTATAQKTENKQKEKKKNQSITIVRSGNSDEKITVEVDGDKVTINGKPVEDYKGEVRVISGDAGHFNIARPGRIFAPRIPGAPMAIAGLDKHSFVFGDTNKAVLGVSFETTEGGAKITGIHPESSAEKAGLKEGDIITKVNEYNVADANDLPTAISKFKPQDKVTITYKRDGKAATTTANLDRNKGLFGMAMAHPEFDFQFDNGAMAYSFARKPRLGLQIEDLAEGDGVKVLDVNAETPAAKAGLQKDDIITLFNGKEVKNIEDLRNSLDDVKEGDTVKLSFKRAGTIHNTEIKFPKPVRKTRL